MPDFDVTIKGLQQAMDANVRAIAALQPSGELGRAIRDVTVELARYKTAITHVDTGAYRASTRMEVTNLRGRIYIDPTAYNPRSRQLVTRYAPDEEARGGSHASFQRTLDERAQQAVSRVGAVIAGIRL